MDKFNLPKVLSDTYFCVLGINMLNNMSKYKVMGAYDL